MPSPFLVNVGALRRVDGTRWSESRHGPMPGLALTGSAVPDDGEVLVDVMLESVPGAVVVTGTVEAPWRGECRRCLSEATGRVRIELRELFEEHPDPDQTYPLDGDRLDLALLARDAVLLELPLAPLCSQGCQGLCLTCGADRNQGDCGCAPEMVDHRWAALDALREI
ncbi:MAG: YceD family protein [Acidimicrobiales bacterium]